MDDPETNDRQDSRTAFRYCVDAYENITNPPNLATRIRRYLNESRTISRWEYWAMGIGSGTCASAITTFVNWL